MKKLIAIVLVLSGSSTRVIIWNTDAPMLWAASITPWSTSFSDPSTMRPTYGAAAITSGGITAVEPMVVPTKKRVSPSTHTMSIRITHTFMSSNESQEKICGYDS